MKRRRSTGTVRVYEVLHDGDYTPRSSMGDGAAGDGTFIRRFRTKQEAELFAGTATLYGGPVRVVCCDAPRHIAERWGMA